MKKILYLAILSILFITILSNNVVFAAVKPQGGGSSGAATQNGTNTSTTNTSEDTWVQDAFSAAAGFLNEDISETDDPANNGLGIVTPILKTFKGIVKSINTILLVLLAALSTLSLSITGIRYIVCKANPAQEKTARENLHTAFRGMLFGFGAYIIWSVAMGLVQLIIGNFTA